MANSKLLKEAIADAKAVKETALANAKLALEEAFTPRLQSMLTKKMKAEAEESIEEELDSDGIGASTSQPNTQADTEGDFEKEGGKPGSELADYTKTKEISEDEDFEFGDEEPNGEEELPGEDDKDAEIAELRARLAELEGDDVPTDEPTGDEPTGDEFGSDEFQGGEDEDENDLESIIRELEAQLGDDEPVSDELPGEEEIPGEAEEEETPINPVAESKKKKKIKETLANGEEAGTDKGADPKLVVTNEAECEDGDEIDLEEILREMESDLRGDDEKEEIPAELEKELQEAYTTIKSLQRTINEVNLLNAKLLFANKLFRSHNMTNEQKIKVIETLDRTKNVREVKLVYSTLAENFKYSSSNKPAKKAIAEGIASRAIKSTKPNVEKQIISEATQMADRFKHLAGIK